MIDYNKISEILNKGDNLSIKNSNDDILIEYSSMYSTPEVDLAALIELSTLFQTKKIQLNPCINQPGCETCDYGSDYGHEIYIRESPIKITDTILRVDGKNQ